MADSLPFQAAVSALATGAIQINDPVAPGIVEERTLEHHNVNMADSELATGIDLQYFCPNYILFSIPHRSMMTVVLIDGKNRRL